MTKDKYMKFTYFGYFLKLAENSAIETQKLTQPKKVDRTVEKFNLYCSAVTVFVVLSCFGMLFENIAVEKVKTSIEFSSDFSLTARILDRYLSIESWQQDCDKDLIHCPQKIKFTEEISTRIL